MSILYFCVVHVCYCWLADKLFIYFLFTFIFLFIYFSIHVFYNLFIYLYIFMYLVRLSHSQRKSSISLDTYLLEKIKALKLSPLEGICDQCETCIRAGGGALGCGQTILR